MRIYLDACYIQRPFDDQTQPRIRVEAEAVLAILAAVHAGDVILLSSEALEFEIDRIPDEQRRTEALAILSLASERLTINDQSESLAESLVTAGLSALDALLWRRKPPQTTSRQRMIGCFVVRSPPLSLPASRSLYLA